MGQKKFVSEKLWAQKHFGWTKFEICVRINFGFKENSGTKKFRSKKTLGPKKFELKENFVFEKILGPQKFCLKIIFDLEKLGSKKNVWSKRKISSKEILCLINFGSREILG